MTKALTWITIVLVHGAVTAFVPLLLLHATGRLSFDGPGVLQMSGVVAVLVGGLTILGSMWGLTSAGQGMPAPFDPPRELVVKGLYRFVRNPMYLGDVLVLSGEALLFGSAALLSYALLMLGVFHLFVTWYEEPALRRSFGTSYERYCKAVPRWIPSRSVRK